MTEFNALNVCRLCLSAERLDDLTHHFIYIISTCFSVKIHMSSELTNKICQACIKQLQNVYKYRKKIIRNEIILLEKLKDNVTYHSVQLHSDLQIYSDVNEVKDNTVRLNFNELEDNIDIADDKSDCNESNMAVPDEIHEVKRQEDNTIAKSKKNTIEPMEKEQSSRSNIESIWQNLNFSNKQMNDSKVLETENRLDDLNNSVRDQIHNMTLNNPDISKEGIEDLIINKYNLEVNVKALSIIQPVAIECVDTNDTTQETNKENTYMNNLTTIDNTNDKETNAGVVLNQNQFNAINMDRKYMCLTCLKVFESQKELSTHYKTVELAKALTETSRKFKDSNIVKVSSNNGKAMFKCGLCSRFFENKGAAIKHTDIHKVERPFLCNLCSRTYKTVADIIRHGVVHSGYKLVCSYKCGYTTVHLGALREHVKRHKKEFKYKCEKCGKCFQVKTWYDQHQNVHDKVRPFLCKLCGQAFSMARYLTAHIANVHPQSSKVKRYKCVHCSLPCDSRNSLVLHMKQKHGLKTDCLCDVCGQILPDQQKLILHKAVHGASKKFSCRFCKKTFNKKDHKTVHEKIHTGERLSCNSCPKSFTQRCSLRRHIKRYHQGDQQSLEQKT